MANILFGISGTSSQTGLLLPIEVSALFTPGLLVRSTTYPFSERYTYQHLHAARLNQKILTEMYSADVSATSIFPHSHLLLPFICNNVLNEEGEICECWYESILSDVVKSHDGTRRDRPSTSLCCPFCSKTGVHSDLRNSFGVICPDQSQPGVWLQEQNDKTPFEVAKGSRYLAWFHCFDCDQPFQRTCQQISRYNLGCIRCEIKGFDEYSPGTVYFAELRGIRRDGNNQIIDTERLYKIGITGYWYPETRLCHFLCGLRLHTREDAWVWQSRILSFVHCPPRSFDNPHIQGTALFHEGILHCLPTAAPYGRPQRQWPFPASTEFHRDRPARTHPTPRPEKIARDEWTRYWDNATDRDPSIALRKTDRSSTVWDQPMPYVAEHCYRKITWEPESNTYSMGPPRFKGDSRPHVNQEQGEENE